MSSGQDVPPPPSEGFSTHLAFLAESLRLSATGSFIPLAPTCTTLLSTSDYLSHLASPRERQPLNASLPVPPVPRVRTSAHTQHNNHLKNNTKNLSLITCFYHVPRGYYSLFVVVRTQTKTCHNLTPPPISVPKNLPQPPFFDFFLFSVFALLFQAVLSSQPLSLI